jgi:lipopolysaccharide/colanic/teichoic acid biosynthesis glycosyltransferase
VTLQIYPRVKSLVDVFGATLLLVACSPILLVLVFLLFLSDPSNPFFVQERIGHDERVFRVIKLRTMTAHTGTDGALASDAERLTALGRIVRRTSLDEIPQLINIVRGEMSFIGPRPLLVRYLPYYRDEERVRHTVLPGITGLAQINGRNDLGWDDRLAHDISYVRNMSARQDFKILLGTVKSVVTASGVKVDVLSGHMRDLDVERA